MILLTAEHIKKSYTEKPLLTDISLSIFTEDKIGLVGVNGSGKSTLLKIIAGAIEAEGGEIVRNNQLRVGYLPQNPAFDPDLSVLDQALLYADIKAEEAYKVKAMLTKVGIEDLSKAMGNLSGGQRKRVALAGVLARNTNLLILDEPTNHMDNYIIEWMEEYLQRYKGAIFMITHDRYFLERVTNKICEIQRGKLETYIGNYDSYLEQKMEKEKMLLATERKRAAIYKKELRWIRWSAPARTTKAKGRIERFKQLENDKLVIEDPHLSINTISSRLGKKVMEIDRLSKGYDEISLINDFTYTMTQTDRIGIVGVNGCGKTTLLKLLVGQLEPDSGKIDIGETVKIGYFSQEHLELNPKERVIKYISDIAENIKTEDGYLSASQMLERFLFPSHMHRVEIGRLSGGEQRRLYLLSVLMTAPNVLIFDEPTNDLDIDTLTVLEDYLDNFPGVVIIVSHDRYFLDRLVDKTFAFEEDGKIVQYTGGYSKYMNAKEEASEEAVAGTATDENKSTEDTRHRGPQKLKFTYKEKLEYENIENDIEALEKKIGHVEEEINQIGSDLVKLTSLAQTKEELEEKLMEKMERWEYLSDLAQRIERGDMAK